MFHTNCSSSDAANNTREWFAFRVRPRHEKSVALQLKEKREECFVPLVRKSRRWAKRVAYVDLPLISGYVFCRSHRFGMLPILKTPGVVDVIRAGNSPVPIPDMEISALDRAISAEVPIEPCPYLEIGERIEVLSGPLAGVVGVVRDRKKSDYIVLSVSMLRRSVLVQVEAAHLRGCETPYLPAELSTNDLIRTIA